MAADDQAFRAAADWLDAMMRRELAAKGQASAAAFLSDTLDLVPVAVEREADGATRVTAKRTQKLGGCSVRVNAVTGEPVSWYLEALARGGDRSVPADEMLRRAGDFAKPPQSAVLAVADYEFQGGRTVFRARWHHEVDGVEVDGDVIEVLMNGAVGRPFALTVRWRQPDPAAPATER